VIFSLSYVVATCVCAALKKISQTANNMLMLCIVLRKGNWSVVIEITEKLKLVSENIFVV
jgi:hypothetical protein